MSLVSLSASSEKNKTIEYSKINAIVKFSKEDLNSPYAKLVATIHTESMKDPKVTIRSPNFSHNLEVNNLVIDSLPLLGHNEAESYWLEIEAPESSTSLSLTLNVDVNELELAYKDLFVVLEDFNTLKKSLMGKLSWLSPNYETLIFEFSNSAKITITKTSTLKEFFTDDSNKIEMEIDEELMNDGVYLRFSTQPNSIIPST